MNDKSVLTDKCIHDFRLRLITPKFRSIYECQKCGWKTVYE